MVQFNQSEMDYLATQKLGRLATVGADGQPHVVPNSVRYNSELGTLDLGGQDLSKTKKWRDVAANPHVAIVVDDVLPPWRPRGIEVRGRAEHVATGGEVFGLHFGPEMIRIYPERIISWGLSVE